MKRAFPILALLTAALLGYSFYQAMFVAPTDMMQGEVYRIIYYHVPSGWTMFIFFAVNFVASIIYLVWRNPKADAVAVSAAEIGVVFCTVVLVTGPLWARPIWGIWWTWDWRLDVDAGAVADLCQLSRAAAFFHGRADAGSGRGPGHFWRPRCADCVFLHLVLPHAASAAGGGGWRIHRSAHAACLAAELARVSSALGQWCSGRATGWKSCSRKWKRRKRSKRCSNRGSRDELLALSLRRLRRNLDYPSRLPGDDRAPLSAGARPHGRVHEVAGASCRHHSPRRSSEGTHISRYTRQCPRGMRAAAFRHAAREPESARERNRSA